eukprot:symbB.v1.2.028374.t1/scaffold2933.1/size66937/2
MATSMRPMDLESQMDLRGISKANVQLRFVQKVYGIVSVQLLFTAMVAGLCCGPWQSTVLSLVERHPSAFQWGSLIALLLAMLVCSAGKKSYPVNFYGLGLLTTVMAFDVGVICAMVSAVGLGSLIAQAALITGLLVVGLTIYTFRSKRNFSWLGAALFPILFGMIGFSLLSIFIPALRSGWIHLAYSFFGAAVFCLYLVYDTWRLANELNVDDYVEGAIQLYMDIINLFLQILDILLSLAKDRR